MDPAKAAEQQLKGLQHLSLPKASLEDLFVKFDLAAKNWNAARVAVEEKKALKFQQLSAELGEVSAELDVAVSSRAEAKAALQKAAAELDCQVKTTARDLPSSGSEGEGDEESGKGEAPSEAKGAGEQPSASSASLPEGMQKQKFQKKASKQVKKAKMKDAIVETLGAQIDLALQKDEEEVSGVSLLEAFNDAAAKYCKLEKKGVATPDASAILQHFGVAGNDPEQQAAWQQLREAGFQTAA